MIKSRARRLARYITCTGKLETRITFWLENLKGRRQLEDLSVSGRIILK
jgi:hypothetical protein